MQRHVAPQRRCRFFVHISWETLDVTPPWTMPRLTAAGSTGDGQCWPRSPASRFRSQPSDVRHSGKDRGKVTKLDVIVSTVLTSEVLTPRFQCDCPLSFPLAIPRESHFGVGPAPRPRLRAALQQKKSSGTRARSPDVLQFVAGTPNLPTNTIPMDSDSNFLENSLWT